MPPKSSAPMAYCVKCHRSTPTADASHGMAGHRHMLKGVCAECGTRKTKFVGAGFFDDLRKGISAVAGPLSKVVSIAHPKAGAAIGATGDLVNNLFGAFGKGVKGPKRKRGGGLLRTSAGGSIARAGGSIARAGAGVPKMPKVGKGVLDDEITTDLHLKR